MRYLFGRFALDESSRQLKREGRAVALTPRAFELLRILLAERPRAMDKAELIRRLWPDTFVSEGSLAQLVTELRRALGDRARAPRFLRTVFRHGYAFCGEAREEPEHTVSARSAYALLWQGREVALHEGENLIGRDPEAVIRLASPLASRRHARILVAGASARLQDLGSKNGTWVEGRRVEGERPLAAGDHIAVGEEVMVFCAGDAGGTTRSAPRRS